MPALLYVWFIQFKFISEGEWQKANFRITQWISSYIYFINLKNMTVYLTLNSLCAFLFLLRAYLPV